MREENTPTFESVLLLQQQQLLLLRLLLFLSNLMAFEGTMT